MNMKSVAKGVATGAAAGLACYVISSCTPSKKKSIKKDAGKTFRAMESLLEDIASAFA